MTRRLAAVLIADVVGYGRLSQRDEEGTRARFQADLQELYQPKIAQHGGRLVKTMGDGLLVEFASVVDALRCAVDVQQAKAEGNASVPADDRIEFRIGINLGDIIVEGDDIHGDGVNIADRLQGLAEPGGIVISGTAYDQVEGKLAVGYEFRGKQQVKNIDRPVRVYRVLRDAVQPALTARVRNRHWWWAAIVAAAAVAGVLTWLQPWNLKDTPDQVALKELPAAVESSIVVLPLKNMSGDADQGYLADGITEDITTDLARVPGLFVMSRNAAFQYKDKNVDTKQIAADLGVRYILEGSVRRVGNELRINVQLIDAETGLHKWAERFDGQWTDVFQMQDVVVQNVVNALELRLGSGESGPQAPGGTSNTAAYEAYLRGLELVWRDTPDTAQEAVQHLKKAIALDPDYGEAYAVLAQLYWHAAGAPEWERALGGISQAEANTQSVALLQDAMKHPSPRALWMLAEKQLRFQQHDAAIADLERAIALDPSNVDSFAWMAYALNLAGRPEAGQRYLDAALRLDPRASERLGFYMGFAQFCAGHYEEAAATLEKALAKRPDDRWSGMLLVSAYGHLGRDAAPLIEKLNALVIKEGDIAFTQLLARILFPFKDRDDAERLRDGLSRAGVPALTFGYDPASKDRMNDDEIKAALFGHTLHGPDIDSGATWKFIFAADGSFVFSSDSPLASVSSEAGRIVETQDGVMCWAYPATGARGCGTLFRAPGNTLAQPNEALWISHIDRIHLSIVE